MITDHQTNMVYISDLLPRDHPQIAEELRSALGDHLDVIHNTKDIWCRDCMPLQLERDKFVQFKFDPDYLKPKKYQHLRTENGRDLLKLSHCTSSDLVIDGGNIVRWHDAAIMTNKIIKENECKNSTDICDQLRKLLEIDRIFLIPREPGDIFGHADGMVRFVDGKTLLVNDYSKVDPIFWERIKSLLDGFELIAFPYHPSDKKFNGIPSAEGVYINFLQTQDAIVAPQFGIAADQEALAILERVFPSVNIIPLNCKNLAQKGGVLNCITWNIWK